MKNHRIELKQSFHDLSMSKLNLSRMSAPAKRQFLSFKIKSNIITNDLYEVR